ncbi:AMP-binding protein, partial [Azoarcus sp. TTM-91]|uniref:condensation domain-containing protein n=1 Tax=Azoarcus sp. TTM-91 TaxID=2691581 RepID=UPI00145C88EA
SYAQRRQWFLWELDRASTAYHISGGLRLKGEVNLDALQGSFAALVSRHESLRTVFLADDQGLAQQHIQAQGQPAFELIDLSGTPAEESEARARAAAERLHSTPFDLGQGPLLRIGLIRLSAQEHLLIVVMHHIISDGWSMQILVDEFVGHYRAALEGGQANLSPPSIQYADYAQWQRQWLEAGEKARQLDYWQTQLGTEHPLLHLPTDHPRRADGRYSAARRTVSVPEPLTHKLRKLAQAEHTTVFVTLLAGLQALLHRYTGQEDIRIGVPIANRHRIETESVIGFFVNTQVLRNCIGSRDRLADVLARTREAALGAQTHQDLPFEHLVEALQPERSLGTPPLFQVMFNHLKHDARALQSLPGLTLEAYELGAKAAQFELTVEALEQAGGGLKLSFIYARELFDPEKVARLAGHYLALLEALAEEPGQAVSEVALLSAAEREQLQNWSQNGDRPASAALIHRLIEAQAAAHPDAVAVIFGEAQLNYGELNRRANQLAHHLTGLGVGPEVKVGIAVERSLDMVVGLLAILKAGGA